MGSKLVPIFAAMGGTVTRMPLVDDVHGYRLTVAGDDGRTYSYVHLNNDTPGTDDGRGTANQAYAPGVAQGKRVERGRSEERREGKAGVRTCRSRGYRYH